MKKSLLWAIAASLLVAAGVTLASLLQTPTYEASAVLLVDRDEQNSYGRIHPIPEGLRSLTQTMAIAIEGPPVAEGTIRRLGLRVSQGELLNNLSAQQVETSQFIRLSYTDTDSARAKEVVNAVGWESSEFFSGSGRGRRHEGNPVRQGERPRRPGEPQALEERADRARGGGGDKPGGGPGGGCGSTRNASGEYAAPVRDSRRSGGRTKAVVA